MIDFSSCFFLLTLVHIPWSALMFIGVSSFYFAVVFFMISPFLDWFVLPSFGLYPALRWSLHRGLYLVSSVFAGYVFQVCCRFLSFCRSFFLLEVHKRLLLLCFFGLVSRVIHFVSKSGCSSAVVSSFVCWAIVFFIRIPTPPPFLFQFFPVHLYPLMLICWFLSSFVSVISAMLALIAFRSDSMLLTLHLMPLTLTVIMVICFVFSDSGPFCFPLVGSGGLCFLLGLSWCWWVQLLLSFLSGGCLCW